MTQHKAAALTSSLFARKGTASPASLLIADLEASGLMSGAGKAGANGQSQSQTQSQTQAQVQAESGAEGNAGLGIDLGHQKIPVAALNGSAGRRKAPAAEAELPLLAFVEAQNRPETDAAPGRETAGDSAETSAANRRRAGASKPASAPQAEQDGLPPAASLLDSGAQALRRVNGRAGPAPVTDPPETAAADIEIAAETTAGAEVSTATDSADAELAIPGTVSGDDKVTAIEDAPDEPAGALDAAPEAEDEAVQAAAAEDVAELSTGEALGIKAQEKAVPGPALNDAGTDDAPVPPAPPAPAKTVETAAATASAALALRQATAQRPDGPAPSAVPAVTPAPAPAPTPVERPSVLSWKKAAVVALGLALGLGAYVTLSGTPPEAPPEASPGQPLPPTTESAPEPAPEPARSEAAGQPDQLGAATTSDAAAVDELPAVAPLPETAAATAAPPPALPEPSFDIIRIEPDGQSIIAGRALPLSEWILLNNGEPIASIRADGNGEWVVLPDATLIPGANAFSLVPKAEQGRVAIPAPDAGATSPGAATSGATNPGAAVPAGAESPEATPPGPRSEAVPEPGDSRMAFALPRPKPEPAPRVLQTAAVAVSPAGAYEVQFASVRQSADAERERGRLIEAFPVLLGSLELRVQEASVEGAGTFYRVRSGAVDDLGSARDVCRQMEAAGQGCLVVRRVPQQTVPKAQTELVQEPAPKRPSAHQQAERPR